MDHGAISASTFHKLAELYRDKFMGLTLYDDSYRKYCELLRPGRARVLDAACGPKMVSRYVLPQRPDLDLLGIDLAPRMVELAREAVPLARFAVRDCRHLADLQLSFDGIIGNHSFCRRRLVEAIFPTEAANCGSPCSARI